MNNVKLTMCYRQSYKSWSVIASDIQDDPHERSDLDSCLTEMTKWCSEIGFGKRMAYNEFMFSNNNDAMVFMLKFS